METIKTKAKRLQTILEQKGVKNYIRNSENMYIIGFYDILWVDELSKYKWLIVKGKPCCNEIHIFL